VLYMLLLYDSEADAQRRGGAEGDAVFREFIALVQDLGKVGKLKGGDPLEPTGTATTVRVRAGKTAITDGPFAETREQLGGNFIIDAIDLDEAIVIAARIPTARFGSVEVRPVRKINMQCAGRTARE
jgi:hypothetical protein